MKFCQPRIPGSSQVLCTQQSTQQRTELSILYYISTSNNAFRRVTKKDIQNMNISSMIEVLKTPQRPLSLRVYSFLIKGIIKVYILKVKYCEHEIQSMLSGLEVKKLKRKKESTGTVKRESLVLKIDDDFIDGYSDQEEEYQDMSSPVIVESVTNDNSCLDSEIHNDVSEVIDAVPVKKRKRSLIDRKIEIIQNKYVSALKSSDVNKNPCSFSVFKEFETFLKAKRIQETSMPVEINDFEFNLPSTMEAPKSVSSSLALKENSDTYEPLKSNVIDELFSEEDHFNFNKKFLSHSKNDKARIFYRLLELGKLGRMKIAQTLPYDDICVNES